MNNIILICNDTPENTLAITPSVSILKRNFPRVKISVASKYPWIFKDNPCVYKSLELNGAAKLYALLRQDDYDLAILTTPSFKYAAAVYLAKIPKRFMGESFYSRFLATTAVDIKNLPAQKASLAFLNPLFIFLYPAGQELFISKEDDAKAAAVLEESGLNKKDKIICLFTGGKEPNLNADKEFYAKLIDRLSARREDIKFLLIAENKKDLHTINEIFWLTIKKPAIIREALPPQLIAAVTARAKGVIGGCSLGTYMAGALNKKSIVLSPLKAEEFFTLPQGCTVLKPRERACQANCIKNCKAGCIKEISLARALECFDKTFPPAKKQGIFNDEGTFSLFNSRND